MARVLRYNVKVPAVLLVALSGCGSGTGSTTATGPSGGGPAGRTITIAGAGVSPTPLTVTPGTRVMFVNADTQPHNMTSDPHPEHDDCPEINQVGLLTPGQSRETGNLNTVRTCGFHDHDNPPPGGVRWSGSIIIR
jgi:plastocyanin